MAEIYVGSTKWSAVTPWAAATAYSIGDLRRQLATPTVGNERVFRCTTAGTSGGAEPSWTLTAGGTTNDGTAVWTEVTGQSTYNWSAPHARLANSLATGWSSAGDTIYVSNNHSETQGAAITLTSNGSASSPIRILCVADTGTPGALVSSPTASVVTTGNFNINFGAGYTYVYGIIFSAGNTSSSCTVNWSVASSWWRHEMCAFRIGSTSSNASIAAGVASTTHNNNAVEWHNCSVQFAHVGQRISVRDTLTWTGSQSAVTGATIPTSLFTGATTGNGRAICIGVDLSALGSGKNIFDLVTASSVRYTFLDCKTNSSASLTTNSPIGPGGNTAIFVNCDGSDTQHRYHYQDYSGTITESTVNFRNGGATDGTTTYSRKFVISSNSKFFSPLVGPWFMYWNTSTGSPITVAAEVLTDGVTLNDAEAWIEVEYQGGTNTPDGRFLSDRAADILATPVAQTTSTESWTTSGITSAVTQTLSKDVTPTEIGWIRARVCVAKGANLDASTAAKQTVYVCPKILSTSSSQRMVGPDGDIINAPASGSSGSSSCFIF